MDGVEPIKRPLDPLGAAAPLAVIEPDEHKGQRGGQFEQHHHRADDALVLPVVPGQVERHDERHADGSVVRLQKLGEDDAAQRSKAALPRNVPLGVLKLLHQRHGQHAQRQRPVDILVAPVEGRPKKGHVKGDLAEKSKQEQPLHITLHIVGVEEAQQEAEDGESQPPDGAQDTVHLEQRCRSGVGRKRTGRDQRHQKPCFKAGSPDVVDEHGDAGHELERGPAQALSFLYWKCFHSKSLLLPRNQAENA